MIEFSTFSFQYKSQTKPTLHEINLRIRDGEKILIAGASGSGKSTLGSCINGLIPHSLGGHIEGSLKINIDMTDYEAASPCMVIIMHKQTFKVTELPDNMNGDTIIMSDRFSNELFNEYSTFSQLRKNIELRPVIPLSGIESAFSIYLRLLDNLIKSPVIEAYKFKAAKHLTLSMFYSTGSYLHNINEIKPTDRRSMIFNQFEKDVKTNYRKEREVSFYAEKLFITPKYLSAVVLQQTGKSALKLINEYVINDCQALLLSTNLTVQQISNKLNFPSQAAFSKFFKRMTGFSPLEYRKRIL